ncbi:MBL fold metallo-hydrolase [Mariniluteicoccus endophyticus]
MAVIHHLLAPNPGPMTMEGTNTLIVAPHVSRAIVIDPGPPDEEHLTDIETACENRVHEVWYTHHHPDHTAAGPELARRHGATIRAFDPALCTGEPFTDGEVVAFGPVTITVLHLPGHTADSVGFLVESTQAELITGDTVLGRGTSVIAAPDGDLEAYLDTLMRLQRIVDERSVRRIVPGHGPMVNDPAGVLRDYMTHRRERLDQVRRAVADGAETAADVVDRVYGLLAPELRHAAEQSAQAQLDFLRG